jgi:hypothetical protein
MLRLCWSMLGLAPWYLKNPTHDIFFPNKDALSAMLSLVTFAPGLAKILTAATPPTIKMFKRLPKEYRGLWGVYVVVLEKKGRRPIIYIGSATDKKLGMHVRSLHYSRKNSRHIPQRVSKALARGYRITHIGLLCQTPIPSVKNRYLLRSLFIILETAFSFTLWAMRSRTKSYGMPKLLPWPIEELEYDGCCTHSALWEGIIDENKGLTPEQIVIKEAQEAIRDRKIARRAERNYHARLRKADPVAYKRNSRAKNKKQHDSTKAKARFHCDPCDKNYQSLGALRIHETRADHIALVTGVPVSEVVAAIKAAKTHYCDTCDIAYATPESLTRHNKQKHAAKTAEASS